MPRERQRQDQKTHKAVEMLRSGVLMMLWIRLSFWVRGYSTLTRLSISQLFHNTKVPIVQTIHTGGSFSETVDWSMNDVPGMRQKQVPTNREKPEDCQTTRGLTTQRQCPILQTTRRSEPKTTKDPVWSDPEIQKTVKILQQTQRGQRPRGPDKTQRGQGPRRPDRPSVVRGPRARQDPARSGSKETRQTQRGQGPRRPDRPSEVRALRVCEEQTRTCATARRPESQQASAPRNPTFPCLFSQAAGFTFQLPREGRRACLSGVLPPSLFSSFVFPCWFPGRFS